MELVDEWIRLENAFHDNLPSQGETGDPAHGKALCQFLYDNSQTIRDEIIRLTGLIELGLKLDPQKPKSWEIWQSKARQALGGNQK